MKDSPKSVYGKSSARHRRRRKRQRLVERLEPRWVLDGSIAGTVFGDLNNNGQFDSGESGVADQVVTLDLHNDGSTDRSTKTGSDGTYTFGSVPAGTHSIRQQLGVGVWQTGILEPTSGNIFLDISDRRDHAFDPTSGILYVTRADNSGTIERYDVVRGERLSPFHVGARAGAVAVTTNGKYLLVGEAMRGLTSIIVRKVEAASGEVVATMHFPQASLESGVFDIAVVSPDKALVTTSFAGSGWVPLHQIDLTSDTLSRRTFEPAGAFDALRQNTRMTVSGDGQTTFFAEANISSGPIHLYDSASDSFIASRQIWEFVDNKATAINHDGSMIAISHGGRIRIYDRDLNQVDDTIVEHAFGLAFSADSKFIYALSGNSLQIEIYRLSDGANVGEIAPGESFAGAFGRYEMSITPNGTHLIMHSRAGVRVYPIFKTTSRVVVVGQDEEVQGIDFGQFANAIGPRAVDDDASVGQNGPRILIDVLANDFVTPGTTVAVTALTDPAAGGTAVLENGEVFYTPAEGFVGVDTFVYTLSGSKNVTDTALVTVQVGGDSLVGRAVDEEGNGIPGAGVFLDLNNNGARGENEPLHRTDAHGWYSFDGLADNEYVVRQLPEPGYDPTQTATSAALYDYIEMRDRVSFAYDPSREALWILEANSLLWHYDLATKQMLGNWDLGEKLSRIDIFPDGEFALITGPEVVDGKASVLKVDLNTKAVEKLEYAVGGGETTSFDISIFSNDLALFSGRFSGSGWVPIRQLDLSNDTITTRSTDPTIVRQDTHIFRSADRQHGIFAEANASNGPISRYQATANSFPIGKGLQEFAGRLKASVTADFFAGNTTTATSIVDMKTLDTVEILDSQGGGVAFDPLRNVFYAADMNFDELRAYDTSTWRRLYAVPLGEDISNQFAEMDVSADGRFLFTTTPTGIRVFRLEHMWAKHVHVVDGGRSIVPDFRNNRNGDNRRPFAVDPPLYSVVEDSKLSVSVPGLLDGAYDPDGDQFTAKLNDAATNGTAAVNADGSFTYTPNADFFGQDRFSFVADDGATASSPIFVTIDVVRQNDPPVASDDDFSVDEDATLTIGGKGVLGNDSDPDGDSIEATLVQTTDHGALTLRTDGTFTYSPDKNFFGSDSFRYKVSDGQLNSDAATVSITVRPINDAPVAAHDQYSIDEDVRLVVDAAGGVRKNDVDVEGDVVQLTVKTLPENGALSIALDGSFQYTPDEHFHGVDSFVYELSDETLSSSPATVDITVKSVNDVPIAVDEQLELDEDKVVAFDPLANDIDHDGDTLRFQVVTPPERGSHIIENGRIRYTPEANYFGADKLIYEVDDGIEKVLATASLQVKSVNDAPVIGALADQEFVFDTPATLLGPRITDVDAAGGDVLLRLSVDTGAIFVSPEVSGGVSSGNIEGSGSGQVELRGTVDQINETVVDGRGLTYRGQAILRFQLNVFVDDLGNRGSGGSATASQSFDVQMDNPFPWTNPRDRLDVDGNGSVVILDTVAIVTELRSGGSRELPRPTEVPRHFFDVTRDNRLSLLDLANHVSALHRKFGGGEPENRIPASPPETMVDFGRWLDDEENDEPGDLNVLQRWELERTLRKIV